VIWSVGDQSRTHPWLKEVSSGQDFGSQTRRCKAALSTRGFGAVPAGGPGGVTQYQLQAARTLALSVICRATSIARLASTMSCCSLKNVIVAQVERMPFRRALRAPAATPRLRSGVTLRDPIERVGEG
jgi:hypothetical protein